MPSKPAFHVVTKEYTKITHEMLKKCNIDQPTDRDKLKYRVACARLKLKGLVTPNVRCVPAPSSPPPPPPHPFSLLFPPFDIPFPHRSQNRVFEKFAFRADRPIGRRKDGPTDGETPL